MEEGIGRNLLNQAEKVPIEFDHSVGTESYPKHWESMYLWGIQMEEDSSLEAGQRQRSKPSWEGKMAAVALLDEIARDSAVRCADYPHRPVTEAEGKQEPRLGLHAVGVVGCVAQKWPTAAHRNMRECTVAAHWNPDVRIACGVHGGCDNGDDPPQKFHVGWICPLAFCQWDKH